jgi:hypothetical protein
MATQLVDLLNSTVNGLAGGTSLFGMPMLQVIEVAAGVLLIIAVFMTLCLARASRDTVAEDEPSLSSDGERTLERDSASAKTTDESIAPWDSMTDGHRS